MQNMEPYETKTLFTDMTVNEKLLLCWYGYCRVTSSTCDLTDALLLKTLTGLCCCCCVNRSANIWRHFLHPQCARNNKPIRPVRGDWALPWCVCVCVRLCALLWTS